MTRSSVPATCTSLPPKARRLRLRYRHARRTNGDRRHQRKRQARRIASDLVAQAEHDPEALAIFVTTTATLARAVVDEVKGQSRSNPAAHKSIRRNGVAIVARTADEAHQITNRLAPEHLTVDSEADLAWVRNAGSVFIGPYSSQPLGDYISGPNHMLPTSGLARVRGGLSVADFLKVITVQEYQPDGPRRLGPAAVSLAEAEGLHGHAEAIRARLAESRGVL